MYVGVTGGVGSGKSTFTGLLAEMGAVVIDADGLAREALAPSSPLVDQVAARFPDVVVDGAVDRAALAALTFSDPAVRTWLESLIHPEVARLAAQRRAQALPGLVVVYDVPLLAEKGMAGQFDLVVVVTAPLETRLERLAARGMSRVDALARIAAQATDEDRAAVADIVVENGGTIDELRAQAAEVFEAALGDEKGTVA